MRIVLVMIGAALAPCWALVRRRMGWFTRTTLPWTAAGMAFTSLGILVIGIKVGVPGRPPEALLAMLVIPAAAATVYWLARGWMRMRPANRV